MKQETTEEVAERYYPPYPDGMVTSEVYALREGFVKGYKVQQEISYSKKVMCKHCQKPISVNDINNHLFMNINGGGLIHWNCKTI
jgi:hypothetical protein